MQVPPMPPDEAQRQEALRTLDLLDTPPEERFDRITRIARRLFDVPIALVSLIDHDRQWFKSRQGLDATETPRDISFCGHTILAPDIFEVPDAFDDPRFADNPLVAGPPNIRFYAAAPLSTQDGYRVGTLCLIGCAPRRLDAEERALLRDLGNLVQGEFGRTRLEEAIGALRGHEERLRAIVNTANDGIITIGEGGIVESFNPAGATIFGYEPAEVIGRNVNMLMPEPFRSEHDGYIRRLIRTRVPHVIGTGREVVGRRKDGTEFPMDLSVSESVLGEHRFFTGIVRDISARKEAERIKKEFISTISHELRTPLTSIRGSLGLIAGGLAGALPPQAARLIDVAHRNSERLVRLINDILDIDKVESGKMNFAFGAQPLLPLIRQAIEANRAYAEELGVKIELTGDPTEASVYADPDRLAQVLANLLSNAAKFSPPGSTVEVSLERCKGSARVSVRDRGPGVPDTFRERIFEKFSQADASNTRQKGGSGLGLAITRSLIEGMGGRIGYDSSSSGACFWFELAALPHNEPFGDKGGEDASRILICEDDPDAAALIRYMLEEAGYRADIAVDAEHARRMLAGNHYDAMTLDIALPDQDGIALIRELRDIEALHHLPIVVVSARADEGKARLGGGMAVADWLQKPIDQQRLLRVLRSSVSTDAIRERQADSPPARQRILHIEDDADVFSFISELAKDLADFDHAPDLDTAHRKLAEHVYDLVILDFALPDGSGWELLPLISAQTPPPRIVVFSASDVSQYDAQHFAACLVKSNTDNARLLGTLQAQILQSLPSVTRNEHEEPQEDSLR
ncbi:PAS domain S-box protein [Azoarcus sp. KH32C]|uniref:PAS domain S-box protein n=1 Tax=Azoarcus sp. KH32C TaxID=748247 RepID=UPI00023863B3|nr:PAS domain S-box protein [Azoarcus sp. KH32C]BAL24108.1 PAS/PAC sensor hybrid histidine kinase [Azoarcus sp. KH32C]